MQAQKPSEGFLVRWNRKTQVASLDSFCTMLDVLYKARKLTLSFSLTSYSSSTQLKLSALSALLQGWQFLRQQPPHFLHHWKPLAVQTLKLFKLEFPPILLASGRLTSICWKLVYFWLTRSLLVWVNSIARNSLWVASVAIGTMWRSYFVCWDQKQPTCHLSESSSGPPAFHFVKSSLQRTKK